MRGGVEDEGVPMRVVEFDEECGLATCVDDAGVESPVDVEIVSPVREGDVVLVQAGVALVLLDEATH